MPVATAPQLLATSFPRGVLLGEVGQRESLTIVLGLNK